MKLKLFLSVLLIATISFTALGFSDPPDVEQTEQVILTDDLKEVAFTFEYSFNDAINEVKNIPSKEKAFDYYLITFEEEGVNENVPTNEERKKLKTTNTINSKYLKFRTNSWVRYTNQLFSC